MFKTRILYTRNFWRIEGRPNRGRSRQHSQPSMFSVVPEHPGGSAAETRSCENGENGEISCKNGEFIVRMEKFTVNLCENGENNCMCLADLELLPQRQLLAVPCGLLSGHKERALLRCLFRSKMWFWRGECCRIGENSLDWKWIKLSWKWIKFLQECRK